MRAWQTGGNATGASADEHDGRREHEREGMREREPQGARARQQESRQESRRRFGVVGGLGPLASADVFFKLVKATTASPDDGNADVIFEQHPFGDPFVVSSGNTSGGPSRDLRAARYATTQRKLYVYDVIHGFERRGVTTVVLPCFLSHTFIDELKANTRLQIVDLVEAVRDHIERKHPDAMRIGVLASDVTRGKRLFERYFTSPRFEVLHPRPRDGIDTVTEAIYGADGIQHGNLGGRPVELLRSACDDLVAQGAQLILPGLTEIALVADQLGALGVPLVDSNQAYAQYAISGRAERGARVFKVGVVGGVGPAATVDFLDKIVANTPASRDQDHIRLMVEQNPQIPDRTENLIGDGADPTVSLYATCRKLEDGDADIIAIPCNTAHAFVDRIQPYLRIPIVNMLTVTVDSLRECFPGVDRIGLLATSGTIESGVYRKALAVRGLREVVPPPALQERVMAAIYGPCGVKAGYTTGQCVDDLSAAVEELIAEGIEVIVLGCTELPILLTSGVFIARDGRRAQLVDPTEVLARRCVAEARRAGG